MEHSVENYLQRLSTEELVTFLWWCLQMSAWDRYEYMIPQIIDLLQKRDDSVPKQILEAWHTYRKNK